METYKRLSQSLSKVSAALSLVDRKELEKAVNILRDARQKKHLVFIVGNGGSAANASHFANDLFKIAGVLAISVPDQVSTVTAYGNDDGWVHMFSHYIAQFDSRKSVLIAISCSGSSKNVIDAVYEHEGKIIALTGNNLHSALSEAQPDVLIYTHDDDITVQESIHSAICHAIAVALADEM